MEGLDALEKPRSHHTISWRRPRLEVEALVLRERLRELVRHVAHADRESLVLARLRRGQRMR